VWKPRVHADLEPAIGQAARERADARGSGAQLGRVVVGEEQNAHEGEVNRAAERERIARVYAGYRVDPRRRRAWDARNQGNAAIREELAQAVLALLGDAIGGSGVLLDAGCGTGWWLERLLREGIPGERLVGVEFLADRAQAAAARAPGARIEHADATRLPLPDRSCSLVTLFTVLSSMGSAADRNAALLEALRVLSPGGAVAVWEPRWPTLNRNTRLVRLGELRAALGAGLTVRTITLAPPLARRAGRLYEPLARVGPLRSHRLVLARR
jgi:SAM-dependent methyltransferase